MGDFLSRLGHAADERASRGLTRTLGTFDPTQVLDLAGNDYLGLRTHPRVIDRARHATLVHGAGAGASRLVTGTLSIHDELEERLAGLTGAPSALTFSSGYAANLAALTALSSLAPTDTLIVSDAHAHASLIDGARLSRSPIAVARHNDVAHVRSLLAERSQPYAVVVVESIYSVLGDAAPLTELLALAAADPAVVLLVDEAHALAAAGPQGAGLVAKSLAGQPFPDTVVVTGTLSKALGSQGGALLAHPAVREHVLNTARSFIYDTGLAPAAAGAALGSLETLADEPTLLERLASNAADLAAACGIPTPAGAVMSVPMPGPDQALAAVAHAQRHGIRIGCFRPPSTPDGISRLRLTAHADHAPDEMARATEVLATVLDGASR